MEPIRKAKIAAKTVQLAEQIPVTTKKPNMTSAYALPLLSCGWGNTPVEESFLSTVSTIVEFETETEAVLMVEELTVSTIPELEEAVLMVEELTVSTKHNSR